MTPIERIDHATERAERLARLRRPLAEWAVWIAIAGIAYAQTFSFDREIRDYALGATGWPRAVCALMAAGATGQLLHRILAGRDLPGDGAPAGPVRMRSVMGTAQRVGIFALPFVYLWVMPSIGFYVATPVFIVALMLLLEVRSLPAILLVVAVVYGLVLVIFTRLFYVALPVGTLDPFYGWNNAIIALARTGM